MWRANERVADENLLSLISLQWLLDSFLGWKSTSVSLRIIFIIINALDHCPFNRVHLVFASCSISQLWLSECNNNNNNNKIWWCNDSALDGESFKDRFRPLIQLAFSNCLLLKASHFWTSAKPNIIRTHTHAPNRKKKRCLTNVRRKANKCLTINGIKMGPTGI